MSMFESRSAAHLTDDGGDAYQDEILPKVSRTFALSIPQLPLALRRAVTNAYLLCRIADTIEDEPTFSAEQKRHYENAFIDVVTGHINATLFSTELAQLFSSKTSSPERELVSRLSTVLQVTHSLKPAQQTAIIECLKIMSRGMFDFQRHVSRQGLKTLRDMDNYCYCVAGVVGEMLTELMVDHDPDLACNRGILMPLAASFGQGLQMTNVLKDQWEDLNHGVCWLPQDVFARYGVDLTGRQAGMHDSPQERPEKRSYTGALSELIGVTHEHLRRALDYTLLIPVKHIGYRRFCLMNIGFALMTLRKMQDRLDFYAGDQVKISRQTVACTVAVIRLSEKSDITLRWLFKRAAGTLPLIALSAEWGNAIPTK